MASAPDPAADPTPAAGMGILDALHPAPPLPLTEPFAAGLGPLLSQLGEVLGAVPGSDRVIDLIGDRYTVTVSPDGVRSRGLIRTREVSWADARAVELEPLTVLLTRRVVAGTASSMAGRAVPIPGLRWLIRTAVSKVGDVLAEATARVTPDEVPSALVAVRGGEGDDIELGGPLALASVLSRGLTTAAVAEARDRDVQVRDM